MAAQNGKGSKSRHARIRGRSRTACPEAVGQTQERPKGRVPISHGQAPRGNARGGQSAALAARRAPKSGASRTWDRPGCKTRPFSVASHTHTAGIRRGPQKRAGAPQMGTEQAQAPQPRAARGLQASGRRAPADTMCGRRVPPRNRAAPVRSARPQSGRAARSGP